MQGEQTGNLRNLFAMLEPIGQDAESQSLCLGERAFPNCAPSVNPVGKSPRRLLLARIVSRVDVIDASRADELNLEDRLLVSGPSIMRVFCRVHPQ